MPTIWERLIYKSLHKNLAGWIWKYRHITQAPTQAAQEKPKFFYAGFYSTMYVALGQEAKKIKLLEGREKRGHRGKGDMLIRLRW